MPRSFVRRCPVEIAVLESIVSRHSSGEKHSKSGPSVRGMMADVQICRFDDGSAIVIKSDGAGSIDKEVLAYKVAAIMGVPHPAHIRMSPTVLAMELLPAITATEHARKFTWGAVDEIETRKPFIRMRSLDYVIENSDRHPGNWMIGEDSTLYAIDHGHAFSCHLPVRPRWREHYSPEEIEDIDAGIRSSELWKAFAWLDLGSAYDRLVRNWQTLKDGWENDRARAAVTDRA
jgi:hypothetical protein